MQKPKEEVKMARNQDVTGIVVGILKVVEKTAAKDEKKCIVYRAQCTCGKKVLGSRSQLERYAGLSSCPGHPFTGKEKIIDGFKLVPELRDTDEQKAALVVWETARTGKATKVTKEKKVLSQTGSNILEKRLGLVGYRLETVRLAEPIVVQGLTVHKAVFAKSLTTNDRVFLHIQTITEAGKHGIISSKKKLSTEEWNTLCAAFAAQKLVWREKEPMKKAA
jgi:hypothetical protein